MKRFIMRCVCECSSAPGCRAARALVRQSVQTSTRQLDLAHGREKPGGQEESSSQVHVRQVQKIMQFTHVRPEARVGKQCTWRAAEAH